MSNPARAPREPTDLQLALVVAPDSYLPEGYSNFAARHKRPEEVRKILSGLDMEICKTIVLPKDLSVEARVLQSNGASLALAKTGVPVPRRRSAEAKLVINGAYAKLPKTGPFGQEEVGRRMRDTVLVDGGVEGALGRIALAYPREGAEAANPVTRREALDALQRCGLSVRRLPRPALRPYPLLPKEGEAGLLVNKNSDNGFPVGGKWGSDAAASKCMELALGMRARLERVDNVVAEVRRLEESDPHLVALKGKAKADYYPVEKVVSGRMRFYNVFPRHIMLNMQMATQVLELNGKSILDGPGFRSGIGMSLVRGGADRLVEALDAQLDEHRAAYVHVGDDSWIARRVYFPDTGDYGLEMFALDCSNFDLTQQSSVTAEVHQAIREELRFIDGVAADLWYAYARERMVVLVNSQVRRMHHAGPSGMPLQSKVNDMLMDVMITRLLAALEGESSASVEWLDSVVEAVADGMGFKARLEQYWRGHADTVREALAKQPFLFIGYHFHVREGRALVQADIPRTFAQVPFPALKWIAERSELRATEAMRLGSIALNMGLPTRELEEVFHVFREGAKSLIRSVLDQGAQMDEERLRWAVQETPWGAEVEPSLRGILNALNRDPAQLWAYPELPLPSTSRLVALADWADEVEEEERVAVRAAGGVVDRPATVTGVRARPIGFTRPTTHPATAANDGRPPPTARWLPDRPRHPLGGLGRVITAARTRRRDGIAAREFEEARVAEEFRWYDQQDVSDGDSSLWDLD